jgi:hypothetical protein
MQRCLPGNFVIATRHPGAIFMAVPHATGRPCNVTGRVSRDGSGERFRE